MLTKAKDYPWKTKAPLDASCPCFSIVKDVPTATAIAKRERKKNFKINHTHRWVWNTYTLQINVEELKETCILSCRKSSGHFQFL